MMTAIKVSSSLIAGERPVSALLFILFSPLFQAESYLYAEARQRFRLWNREGICLILSDEAVNRKPIPIFQFAVLIRQIQSL